MVQKMPSPIPRHVPLTKEQLAEHYHSHLEFGRTKSEAIADWLTKKLGSVWFLVINAFFFAFWLLWNTGMLGLPPVDKPPFIMLTMVVSLEAIFLAIIVLISQNRQSVIADVRQKLDFEIDVRSEEEITKLIVMVEEMHKHLGIKRAPDQELEWMKQKIDLGELKKNAEE